MLFISELRLWVINHKFEFKSYIWMSKPLGECEWSRVLGCSWVAAHVRSGLVGGGVKGLRGTNGQVTHESPPHNSQPLTLKLRAPPTMGAWQEFERGYEQRRPQKTNKTKQLCSHHFLLPNMTFSRHVSHNYCSENCWETDGSLT